jgi:hypothetical protein
MSLKAISMGVAVAATILAGAVSAPAPARANDAAAAAAVGFVGGMVVGGALANQNARPAYYERRQPRRCWIERWRDRWGYIRERRVCR